VGVVKVQVTLNTIISAMLTKKVIFLPIHGQPQCATIQIVFIKLSNEETTSSNCDSKAKT